MPTALNRSAVYLAGLQKRFELPPFEGLAYPPAYLAFLGGVVRLRTFDISEDSLRDLWHLEKKLLQLCHVDSTGSPTWFLDACGQTSHRHRRLLLSNHALGVSLTGTEVQTGLNCADSLPELFAGMEMGEDALCVLRESLKIRARILTDLATELPHVRKAAHWGSTIIKAQKQPWAPTSNCRPFISSPPSPHSRRTVLSVSGRCNHLPLLANLTMNSRIVVGDWRSTSSIRSIEAVRLLFYTAEGIRRKSLLKP